MSRATLARCPSCRRTTSVYDGRFGTHGPARNGKLICPSSGTPAPIAQGQA